MADWKDIILTTGIDTHVSNAVLPSFEETVALTGRPLSAYRYYETHGALFIVNPSTMTFPGNNLCCLSFRVTLLISLINVLY